MLSMTIVFQFIHYNVYLMLTNQNSYMLINIVIVYIAITAITTHFLWKRKHLT